MRLDISWKLDRDEPFWSIWQSNADSLRLDEDINDGETPVVWDTVQRTVEQYRSFINQQVLDASRQGMPIMIRPDMDNMLVSTPAVVSTSSATQWSGLSTVERYGQAILWIGAGANLISGSDMTIVDDLGRTLLFNTEGPRRRRLHGLVSNGAKAPGSRATQLQAWIAGPADGGTIVYVVLTNLGPDESCRTFCTQMNGTQSVNVPFASLNIAGEWFVRTVLGGGDNGICGFHGCRGRTVNHVGQLSEGQSIMYKLTQCGSGNPIVRAKDDRGKIL